jgi:hypothetical protein
MKDVYCEVSMARSDTFPRKHAEVSAECLVGFHHIREVLGSNIDPDIAYPD